MKFVRVGEISDSERVERLLRSEPVDDFSALATKEVDSHEAIPHRLHPAEALAVTATAMLDPLPVHHGANGNEPCGPVTVSTRPRRLNCACPRHMPAAN